jgi:hypothetical protein
MELLNLKFVQGGLLRHFWFFVFLLDDLVTNLDVFDGLGALSIESLSL